jgi:hypothetical protein
MAKPGRPRIRFGAKDLKQIATLAGYGLSDEKIAHVLGVSPATFGRRKLDDASVLLALEKGKAVASSIVGQALFRLVKGGNVTAIIWWEKTREGRHEPIRVLAEPPEDLKDMAQYRGLSDDEVIAQLKAARKLALVG